MAFTSLFGQLGIRIYEGLHCSGLHSHDSSLIRHEVELQNAAEAVLIVHSVSACTPLVHSGSLLTLA